MSESVDEPVGAEGAQERTHEDGAGPAAGKPPARRRFGSRRTRWAVAGAAAVVVVGGAAAAAAIHHHEDGRGMRRAVFAGGHEWRGGPRAEAGGRGDGPRAEADGRDGRPVRPEGRGPRGDGFPGRAGGKAPAPLPPLAAADALDKAAAAVKDGKVESLAPVTAQGGGSAWRVVVLGPDGVRHVVTVDGTTGTLTSNTALGG
ncbi:hypothetical protein [Streptomyces sp. NPDC089919]|uniref:hypothetical protein n=1 Tax=Streptomyces sp. NPDC089919 TaxID=3155188 RepID=UPI00343C595D